MTNVAEKEIHSSWPFTSFMVICMVSTFVLGWFLLKEFLSGLLQSRSKEELYGDIMHTGLIVCIFNISKFYLLLCFRKKLEIVDLETEGYTMEENPNKTGDDKDAYEDDEDDHRDESIDQLLMEDQQTQAQELQREQGARENGADLNVDRDQNQEEQNFLEIQNGQNLDYLDGTNRQDNEQIQDQISQDQEVSEEPALVSDDIEIHESGNKNIEPRLSTRKMSGRYRSQSISEGQNYESLRRLDHENIEHHKLPESTIRTGDPGSSKPIQKTRTISKFEKTPSLYDLRRRSCLSKDKP